MEIFDDRGITSPLEVDPEGNDLFTVLDRFEEQHPRIADAIATVVSTISPTISFLDQKDEIRTGLWRGAKRIATTWASGLINEMVAPENLAAHRDNFQPVHFLNSGISREAAFQNAPWRTSAALIAVSIAEEYLNSRINKPKTNP